MYFNKDEYHETTVTFRDAPYPHDMTEEQWRHELAKEVMNAELGTQNDEVGYYTSKDGYKILVNRCYEIADAMIAEGKKQKEK